jgi:thymidylate kinase
MVPITEAEASNVESQLLRAFLRKLDERSVPYCLLAGYTDYPHVIDSDVDFMVPESSLAALPSLLQEVARETDSLLVQALPHEIGACYFVLAKQDGPRLHFLHPDASGDYRRRGRLWLDADAVLANRRIHEGGFYVPAPEDAFLYYVIKRIDKGQLCAEHAAFLQQLYLKEPQACREKLAALWPERDSSNLIVALGSGRALPPEHMVALRSALHQAPRRERGLRAMRTGLSEWLRKATRLMRPTGVTVAFLGPDGSGKSTVIDQVMTSLAPAFRQTQYLHLRPKLLPDREPAAPTATPHAAPPRSPWASLLKLAYLLLDYNAGYLLKVWPRQCQSTLVVFDRYYPDLLVDPRRYRYGGPLEIARFLNRFVPQPDLWIILDAPEQVLQARKQEVDLEESRRQRQAYVALADELPVSSVVDTSRPLSEVVEQVNRTILLLMASKMAKRHGG